MSLGLVFIMLDFLAVQVTGANRAQQYIEAMLAQYENQKHTIPSRSFWGSYFTVLQDLNQYCSLKQKTVRAELVEALPCIGSPSTSSGRTVLSEQY